jgi:hypothetical protein
VKGVTYKSGPVPTMMIAVANKEKWKSGETLGATATKAVDAKAAPSVNADKVLNLLRCGGIKLVINCSNCMDCFLI